MRRFDPSGRRWNGMQGDGGLVHCDGQRVAGPSAGGVVPWASGAIAQVYGDVSIRTMALTPSGPAATLFAGGTDFRGAGGNRWWVKSGATYFTDQGPIPSTPLDIGPDGTFATKRQDDIAGLVLGFDFDHPLSDAICDDVRVFGPGVCSWREGRRVRSVGLYHPTTIHEHPTCSGDVYWVVPIYVNGVLWLIYQNGGRLVLHRDGDPSQGYITPDQRFYYVDAITVAGGLRVVWAESEAEQLGDLRERVLSLDAPMQPLGEPIPDPDPEEEPFDMDMPLAAWRIVEQMHAKFAPTLPATEDGARTLTEMICQQEKFSDPAGGWCWKRAGEGRPPSKDCVARQVAGRFEGWDILSRAGETGPKVLATYPPSYHDLIAEGPQVPIEVQPVNHLGVTPDPDPDPDPDPQPDDQLARIESKLDRLLTVFRV